MDRDYHFRSGQGQCLQGRMGSSCSTSWRALGCPTRHPRHRSSRGDCKCSVAEGLLQVQRVELGAGQV